MVQIFPLRSVFSNKTSQAKSSSFLKNENTCVSGNDSASNVPTIVIARSISDELIHESIPDSKCPLSFVIYSQTVGYHTQTGICAALSIEDYFNGVLKRHENTIKGFEPSLNIDESCRKQKVRYLNVFFFFFLN